VLVDLLVIALATAYALTLIERFVDLTFLRGLLALAFSAAGTWVFEYRDGPALLVSMGGAFLALLMILFGERLATPPMVALERTRRPL
jgi:hypothetical protein